MDAFLMRPGYAELAKTVNSICASITTIFLFTRLWARRTQYKGLWWDDYLRKHLLPPPPFLSQLALKPYILYLKSMKPFQEVNVLTNP